ncbi:MAG TPA: hypothetical protein ENK11_04620 [Phycisphaerales bacterium]|nr:hypothetical protein [Phycisphaerales bacterium]
MNTDTHQHDVSAAALGLTRTVALWGVGAGLIAVASASVRGDAVSAAAGVGSAVLAAVVGRAVLGAAGPRPIGRWAMPVLLAQIVRTLLSPGIGLVAAFTLELDPVVFWFSLLAATMAMLIGETLAVVRLFGAGAPGLAGRAGRAGGVGDGRGDAR